MGKKNEIDKKCELLKWEKANDLGNVEEYILQRWEYSEIQILAKFASVFMFYSPAFL